MRRRINRVPRFEGERLEGRALMAAGAFGINVSPEYVDLAKTNPDWAPIPSWLDPNQPSTPTFDSNGWPTSDAGMGIIDLRTNQWWNGPDPNVVTPNISGTYHISFKGSATIRTWSADFVVQNQAYNPTTNVTTADIVENQVGENAWLAMYFLQTRNPQSATGKGITDLKFMRPGYSLDTTQLFTTQSINASAGFDTIRVIDATRTVDYTADPNATSVAPVEWWQRRLPTDASQANSTNGKMGQSWEYMVALANTLNSNLWVNIPGAASDDYVRNLANLIKNGNTVGGVTYAGLKPNLKVYVEYSNEVWGGLPNPTNLNYAMTRQYLASGGSPLNSDGTSDIYTLAGRFYLMRSAQISKIFQGVYGGSLADSPVRPVIEWQQGGFQFFRDQLPWFAANYGAPNDYFYGMGGATYLFSHDYSSVDNLFASLRSSAASLAGSVAGMTTVARYYGLKHIAYEGGPSIGGAPGSQAATVALAASRDPRMTSLILDSYKAFYAAGLDLGLYYKGLYEIWSPEHQWSASEASQAANPAASPKYQGLRAVLAASPVPVTAGRPVSATADTPISRDADDIGNNTSVPRTGTTNTWLLNAAQAGTYRLTMVTGDVGLASAPAVIQVLLNDRTVVGTYTINQNRTIDLGSFPLAAGLNTLAIRNIHALFDPAHPENAYYNAYIPLKLTLSPVSLVTNPSSTPALPTIGDGSFERLVLPDNSYRYNPINTGWTFQAGAGLSTNATSMTYANPGAPDGAQVLFLQSTGSVSQTVRNWAAGTYSISLQAARRSFSGLKPIQVLVDGNVVATFSPNSASYKTYTTPGFTVSAGNHVVTLQGVATASSDEVVFIDGVSIASGSSTTTPTDPPTTTPTNPPTTTTPIVPTIADGSFEQVRLPVPLYQYHPTGTGWTFTGMAGLSTNATAMTYANPGAPDGNQVLYMSDTGSVSQTGSNWAAGTYSLTLRAARRSFSGLKSFQVLVDGNVVATFSPNSASYQAYTTPGFTLAAGDHTVTLQAVASATSNEVVFIDGVSIASGSSTTTPTDPPTSVPTIGDGGFEQARLAAPLYQYYPTGTGWMFSGMAGISTNATAMTYANPGAPDGNQILFLSDTGSVSQAVSNWGAGTYAITLKAARRSFSGLKSFQVLVDGNVVATFSPNSASYQAYTTPGFTVSAGNHTITLQAVASASSNEVVFIDSVSLGSATTTTTTITTTTPTNTTAPAVADGGFEQAQLPAPLYQYYPTGTGWTFTGMAGISTNATAMTYANPTAPDGNQVLFLSDTGSVSQTINNWQAGTYALSLKAARRSFSGLKSFQVLVDGNVVATFSPNSASYQAYTTPGFTVSAGNHTITLQAVASASSNEVVFIDSVSLAAATGGSSASTGGSGAGSAAASVQSLTSATALAVPLAVSTPTTPAPVPAASSAPSPWTRTAVAGRFRRPQTPVLTA